PIYLHPSLYKSRFSQGHVGEAPAFYYENVTQFLDTTWGNPNNLTIKRCTIDFTVPETMQGPIFMFYRLTNFNQNRRQYIKSYDPGQLAGQIVDPATLNSNCGPLATNENNLIYYPCGLIANSMFNDTASDLQSVTRPSISYKFQRTNIAWPSDKQKYHPTTYSISSIVPPINWANRYPNGTYTQDYPPPDLSNMERLMIWMHVAALPDFRKLWARNDRDSLASDHFDTTPYGGTKWLVISTTSPLGGKNPFLGIIYMTVGGIILLLGILFTLRHYLRPRQLSKLLKDAAKGLEDLHSQFEDVDRNLQTVHSLGKQVYESAQLWQDFHKAINRNSVISFEHKEKPKA
ncbi:hypothetical protein CU097_000500, partial [Rhizopus azygosporus]